MSGIGGRAASRNRPEAPIRTLLALEYAVDNGLDIAFSRSTIGRYGACGFSPAPGVADPGDGPEIDHNVAESLRSNSLVSRLGETGGVVVGISRGRAAASSGFGWTQERYRVSEKGRQVLERSRRVLAEFRAGEAARKEEFVVVRRPRLPGAGALCRVVRRTDKRVYVEVVDAGPATASSGLVHSGARSGETCVHVDDVYAEGVDLATWRRLSEATAELDRALGEAEAEFRARMAPIRAEHDGRVERLMADFAASTEAGISADPLTIPER